MTTFLSKLYDQLVVEKPKIALLLTLMITIGMSLGLANFKLDASADSLTLERDEDLDFHRQVSKKYGTDNFLVITFTPKTGDLFDDDNLKTIGLISNKLSIIDGVENVSSIVNVPLLYSPKVTIDSLANEPPTLMSADINKELAINEFLNSPVYKNNILSQDKNTTAILLTIAIDSDYVALAEKRDALRQRAATDTLSAESKSELKTVIQEFYDYQTMRYSLDHKRVKEVRDVLSEFEDRGKIFLGGPDMITADLISFIKKDLLIFGIAITIFIVIILSLIFKEPEFVFLPLVSCASCVLIVLGGLSWFGWKLTIISSNFILLLIILTLAINIHLIVRFRELSSTSEAHETKENVKIMVKTMFKPCLYTMLTTMAAFLSLITSNIRPVIDFGLMMTVGVGCAFVSVFIVIPSSLSLFCNKKFKTRKDLSLNITKFFASMAERQGSQIIIISIFVTIISGIGLTQLKVENKFIDFFHSSTEIHQGIKVVDESLGGTTPLDVIIKAPVIDITIEENDLDNNFFENDFDFDDFSDFEEFTDGDEIQFDMEADQNNMIAPSYWFSSGGLTDLERLHRYLEEMPEIGKVASLVQIHEIATDLSGRNLNDLELSIMRQTLNEEITNQLIKPYWDQNSDEVRIQARIIESYDNLDRQNLIQKIKTYSIEELNLSDQQLRLSGIFILYENMLNSLYKSQIQTLGTVLLGIFLMFLLLFKSIKFSLIAITPNILAAIAILGSMGIFSIPLNIMTITIAAITIGIGVDHSIHYITRFKAEFRSCKNYTEALTHAHTTIGQALFISSITIIIGFSILTFSSFVPSIHFGILTGMAMMLALLGSLTLMPKLILLAKPLGAEE